MADLRLAGKIRPVVVILNDKLAVERTLILYVPTTSQSRGSVLEISLGPSKNLTADSVANVQAIGALPRVRFERRLGVLPTDDLNRVKSAVKLACDLT